MIADLTKMNDNKSRIIQMFKEMPDEVFNEKFDFMKSDTGTDYCWKTLKETESPETIQAFCVCCAKMYLYRYAMDQSGCDAGVMAAVRYLRQFDEVMGGDSMSEETNPN